MAAVNQLETKDGYKKLTKRRDDIIEYLASQKTAKKLASKLLAAEFITHSVYNQANNYATNVVETDRVTVMFDAVLAAVKLNPSKFNKFLSILKEIEGLGDIVAFIDGPLTKKPDPEIETASNCAMREEEETRARDEEEKKAREEEEKEAKEEEEKEAKEEEERKAKERRAREKERQKKEAEGFFTRHFKRLRLVVGILGVIVIVGMMQYSWNLSKPDPVLTVKIQVDYSPPSDFALEPPYYRVASSVKLTCYVHESAGHITYSWYSNCFGDCFAKEENNQSVSTLILQPADTGNYTCVAKECDWQGCNRTASDSVEMRIVGTGIFDERRKTALPENGIIVTSQHAQTVHFYCWFSAVDNDTAIQFIDVSGTDVARCESPFNVTTTTYGDSAVMEIVSTIFSSSEGMYTYCPNEGTDIDVEGLQNEFTAASHPSSSLLEQGMYTCRLHQPNGKVDMNVGIYQSEFNTTPVVTSLQQNTSAEIFSLVCVSTGSPPTNVIWTKDGVEMTIDGTVHRLIQTITNRVNSTYSNVLEINESVNKLPGEYSCKVNNSLGISNTVTTMGRVMQITGHEGVLIVGLTVHISCTTNLKDHVKIQWLFGNFKELETSTTQEVVLHRKLEPSDLNGPTFICRITGSDDTVYNEMITLKVKDFENTVTIDAPSMPLTAGNAYSISCIVKAEVKGTVEWVDSTGSPVINTNHMSVDDPITIGNKTTLTLHFDPLHTSHGDEYICVSSVDILQSVQTASTDIIVEIPIPVISVFHGQSPENTIYTTSQFTLTCNIAVNEAVDTPVDISSMWSGPEGILKNGADISVITTFDVFEQRETIVATLESLTSSETGSYICKAIISPNSPSAYIVTSNESSSEPLNMEIILAVSIQVSYTPPIDVPFQTQHYRAGSQVTLHCHAVGASGPVTYRWTSTCSDCFVSGTSSYVTSNFLRSIDAGLHTCTVTDSIGIEGSSTIPMNVTGAGVYVLTGIQNGSISNNSVIVAKYSSQILQFYCVSNSTTNSIGKLIGIGGRDITLDNYDAFDVTHYNPGGIQITSPYSHQAQHSCNCDHYHCHMSSNETTTITISASSQGVYTCKIPVASGSFMDITFGIYPYGFSAQPRIKHVRQETTFSELFTVECTSTDSPATSVMWVKDGTNLTIDGSLYQKSQSVISRASSTYLNILHINDVPTNIIGRYTCRVSNILGTSSQEITITGLQIHGHEKTFVVGETATVTCSSDLDVLYIEWHQDKGNTSTSLVTSYKSLNKMMFRPVSAAVNDVQYTCLVMSPYGMQKRSVSFHIEIPDSWASVEISPTTDATEGNEYHLTCTVSVISGLTVDGVSVSWLGPDGNVIEESNNTTTAVLATSSTTTSAKVAFQPLRSTNGGDYTCIATIMIPGLNEPPPRTAQAHLVVMSVAAFQLKFGPVQHCIHWTVDKALHMEQAVKAALTSGIRSRSNCNFSVDAIDDGEFSCQTSIMEVVYRNKINGTSDTFTALELLGFIENWIMNEGTFKVDMFRLRTNTSCPIHVQSFHHPECSVNASIPAGDRFS